MKRNNLKISYNNPPIDEELEEALEKALNKFGYSFYASGYDMIDRVRTLLFEKKQ